MESLQYQFHNLCKRNKEGSYSTQANRHKILQAMAKQLENLGFRRMSVKSLKPKHVDALVAQYQKDQLSTGTIKNRMSMIRWWAEKIGKPEVVCNENSFYGIPDRVFVTNSSKARDLDKALLARIDDPFVKASLRLQKAFGLRREEAIKFMPSFADHGTFIRLKSTWCKGGKQREVPVRNDEQREALNNAQLVAGKGSLIPMDYRYVHQLKRYENQTAKAGLTKLHGLRHRYAQIRYEELSGWASPACGGPSPKKMNEDERLRDKLARFALTQEMGHEREQIVAVYIGA